MTLLEMQHILQVFCVRQDDGGGVNRGASDTVKAESSGEDPRAIGGLVSNHPHPRVNKTKQHTQGSYSPLLFLTRFLLAHVVWLVSSVYVWSKSLSFQ